jgi:hypothetical protein
MAGGKPKQDTWKPHIYRVGRHKGELDAAPENIGDLRKQIEPWLSAVFQSEHLSLLLGNGLALGIASAAGTQAADMKPLSFVCDHADQIEQAAKSVAAKSIRGEANFEDFLRVANELLRGLEILADKEDSQQLRSEINRILTDFLQSILESERSINDAFIEGDEKSQNLLISFLLSFASRIASRERLNIFTTNYDRLIEHGCDLAGLHVVDRFVGILTPIFRASRLNIDLHYNPPGIRGEPRYLEGVIRLFKLHGSLDWRLEGKQIKRCGIPFGAPEDHSDIPKEPLDSVMIYPNAAKDMETSEYPYAELFRDFAAAMCRPNSALVTYGYGFGDDHINRVIHSMLTILSTHLVIISYDDSGGRIEQFCSNVGHEAQISLLIGHHFGNLSDLVKNYLPKPAIDPISIRKTNLQKSRELDPAGTSSNAGDESKISPGSEDNADTY